MMELSTGYDAVVLATGSTRPRSANVPGDHLTGVDCLGTAILMGARSVVQFSRRPRSDDLGWSPTSHKAGPRPRPSRTPWPAWADIYRVDYAHSLAGSLSSSTHKASSDDPREYSVRATVISENPKKV